ncbi:OmpA family protein [Erwinia sp. Eh17-17]|uniref:OmpA family protein n=1 Tax=Erwinia sp. Eh17-17 TaxID=3080330 RepID=UPI003207B0B1
MRKSAVISNVLQVVAGSAAMLWLLWYFVPAALWGSLLCTLVIVLVACRMLWLRCRRPAAPKDGVSVMELPLSDAQGPIVLVCGDGLDALFPKQPLRKTAQGCWIKVDDVSTLADVVRSIGSFHPRQVAQLCVMYTCLPDDHQDEGMLRASVKDLRQQIRKLHSLIGFELPVVLSGQFSGPETPWVIVQGSQALVCPTDESVLDLDEWLQAAHNVTTLPVLSQAFDFIRDVIVDELIKADRLCPPLFPFAVALRTGTAVSDGDSLWSQRLFTRTCLQFSRTAGRYEPGGLFADALLPMLSPFTLPVQDGNGTRRTVWILLFCALAAISFSVKNNRDLIHRVEVNLARWYAIPMKHYAPKAQALASLKQDALLLERWQRQGEPLNHSLGLYVGQRLWLALQQAIDTYIPPPPSQSPVIEQAPETIRLDSLSLFDTGKAALKPGSLKMLVSALVDVKARPGWLIVVAGHTDSTGNPQANQQLSLKRAEAVRDWMLQTSDVSPTCFAVQGYGATRPVATNDTPEGRALNRRVEISLVPQADACLAPAMRTSSQDDDTTVSSDKE